MHFYKLLATLSALSATAFALPAAAPAELTERQFGSGSGFGSIFNNPFFSPFGNLNGNKDNGDGISAGDGNAAGTDDGNGSANGNSAGDNNGNGNSASFGNNNGNGNTGFNIIGQGCSNSTVNQSGEVNLDLSPCVVLKEKKTRRYSGLRDFVRRHLFGLEARAA